MMGRKRRPACRNRFLRPEMGGLYYSSYLFVQYFCPRGYLVIEIILRGNISSFVWAQSSQYISEGRGWVNPEKVFHCRNLLIASFPMEQSFTLSNTIQSHSQNGSHHPEFNCSRMSSTFHEQSCRKSRIPPIYPCKKVAKS